MLHCVLAFDCVYKEIIASHLPRPRIKPTAIQCQTLIPVSNSSCKHICIWFFFSNRSKRQIAFGSFHFECTMWWQNLLSNLLWSWCVVPILQEAPASNTFREIRSELVIFPLHVCVFYRTGISMQDQTLWNCFHNRQNTDVVHLFLKCCSVTSKVCACWWISVRGKVSQDL